MLLLSSVKFFLIAEGQSDWLAGHSLVCCQWKSMEFLGHHKSLGYIIWVSEQLTELVLVCVWVCVCNMCALVPVQHVASCLRLTALLKGAPPTYGAYQYTPLGQWPLPVSPHAQHPHRYTRGNSQQTASRVLRIIGFPQFMHWQRWETGLK